MATTAIWDVKGWLGKVVVYVENPDKTENPTFFEKQNMSQQDTQGLVDVIEYATQDKKVQAEAGVAPMQQYVTGINCALSTARDEMMAVKKRYGKEDGIVAFHGYQSFAPGEATPDIAHEIGIRMASELWGERFQVLVATHLDKQNHLHNHFVINSVSFIDGYRYNDCTATYIQMRKTSDQLCKEYGLSVIEDPKRGKAKQYGEWKADEQGKPTWRGLIKKDVDRAISESMTDKQFFQNLRNMGYEIKMGKDISIRPPGKERFVRLARNFGENYTMESICQRILQDRSRPQTHQPKKTTVAIIRVKGDLKKSARIGGLRGLYLYYCYKLGFLPRGRASPVKMHFLLREDIRKLDTITKEARLLSRNRIDTAEQFFSFKEKLCTEMESLTTERKQLRNKTRSVNDPNQLAAIRSEISALTARLSELRKEVRLCEGITIRSAEMSEKLKTIRQETIKEKGERNHEHRRRSGRPNR